MKHPRVTLDQWRTLQAVVDHGGYAQAAEHLHRSQSSVSYTIAKLQEQLGMRLLTIDGRKARLTEAGEVLLRRSRKLLQEASQLEELAHTLEQGWEPEIRLVVDAAFPATLLMQALTEFAPLSQGTRVQLQEVVLSGACDTLLAGESELVIGASVPDPFLGDHLIDIEFIAVAHPGHALHRLGRELTMNDLEQELQVVIRDSGTHREDIGWLGAEHRWTVTSIDTATTAIRHGLGFGWLPRHKICEHLDGGSLLPLHLRDGQRYTAALYLIYGQPNNVGPATRQLADILRKTVTAGHAETGQSTLATPPAEAL